MADTNSAPKELTPGELAGFQLQVTIAAAHCYTFQDRLYKLGE